MAAAARLSLVVGVFTVMQFKFTIDGMRKSVSYSVFEGFPDVRAAIDLKLRKQQEQDAKQLLSPRQAGHSRTSQIQEQGQYQEHGGPDSEGLNEVVTNDSHGDTSKIERDMDHIYYVSKIYRPTDGRDLWINIDQMENIKVYGILSNTQREALRVNLTFEFPYYGHLLKEITVTSGGFLYTGDIMHKMLTATQYIAPLMANFDPCISPNSTVIYFDNGTALVVHWDHVYLQDGSHLGSFTFQAALHSNGRITFVYKEIPVDISEISSVNHPVKIGLSDAFVVLHKMQQIPATDIRRRTIYEYHRIELLKSRITNSTAVELLPLPTCLQFSGCDSCITAHIGFNCSWCSSLQRCSSGFDRNRQEWVDSGCLDEAKDQSCTQFVNITQRLSVTITPAINKTVDKATTLRTAKSRGTPMPTRASATATAGTNISTASLPALSITEALEMEKPEKQRKERQQMGLLVGILVSIFLMVAVVLVTVYIYHHPTSSASLFFIERWPKHCPAIKFRRGSGHPAYAEVEATGRDKEGVIVMEPKDSFVILDRRESTFTTDQRDGFFVPDHGALLTYNPNSSSDRNIPRNNGVISS